MANNVKDKSIPIQLDRERNLKFDLNAFIELEEKYGSIDDAFKSLEGGRIKAIRTILWAGLLHEDENLTEKRVGALVTVDKLNEITDKLTEAINKALPTGDPKNPQTPALDTP
jgi:hypothetical protein